MAMRPLPKILLKIEKRNRHPWVFKKMLERPQETRREGAGARPAADGGPLARDGDAVEVYDRRGRFVGRGIYNSRSQIALRILDWGGRGEPIDEAFLRRRIAEAVRIRREVLELEERTDAYRAVNSEGDSLPGLVVDIYGRHAVCELMSLGFFRMRGAIERALHSLYSLETVTFRADERFERLEGFRLEPAERPIEATIVENGVRFKVNIASGHKTGFFLDQRENRRAFAELARGKRVLDVCCYTGGFALYSRVLGNAREALGVDLDEKAIALAGENARLNNLAGARAGVRFFHDNAFHFLKAQREPSQLFDLVVLDPPNLAPARGMLQKAMRDYFDLNRLALRALKPGGLLLTCSCSGLVTLDSFLAVLASAASDAGRELRALRTTGPGPDHPVSVDCPEGLYLKVVLAQALAR